MIFSKRRKLAEEVDKWFDRVEKDTGLKVSRNTFGVITALQSLGYLKETECPFCRIYHENSQYCRKCGRTKPEEM